MLIPCSVSPHPPRNQLRHYIFPQRFASPLIYCPRKKDQTYTPGLEPSLHGDGKRFPNADPSSVKTAIPYFLRQVRLAGLLCYRDVKDMKLAEEDREIFWLSIFHSLPLPSMATRIFLPPPSSSAQACLLPGNTAAGDVTGTQKAVKRE